MKHIIAALAILGVGLFFVGAMKMPQKDISDDLVVKNLQGKEVALEENISLEKSGFLSQWTSKVTEVELPTSVDLDVPFIPQFPLFARVPPFDEACEEASFLMVKYYFNPQERTARELSDEIIAMVDRQTEDGYGVDIGVDDLLDIVNNYYGFSGDVYWGADVTVESIKSFLAKGMPIIVPVDGELLFNPHFRNDGPPYHVIVLKGYDEEYFYANDPGTKHGNNYPYPQDVLMNAIHNWTGSEDTIQEGEKAMLILR